MGVCVLWDDISSYDIGLSTLRPRPADWDCVSDKRRLGQTGLRRQSTTCSGCSWMRPEQGWIWSESLVTASAWPVKYRISNSIFSSPHRPLHILVNNRYWYKILINAYRWLMKVTPKVLQLTPKGRTLTVDIKVNDIIKVNGTIIGYRDLRTTPSSHQTYQDVGTSN